MVKQGQSAIANGHNSAKRISKRDCGRLIKERLRRMRASGKVRRMSYVRAQELLDESSVECSICLQILLKPVVVQCGHCFCLSCAQVLAKNDFSCGICHSHLPSYNFILSKTGQELVNIYLSKLHSGKKQAYEKRKKFFQEKEAERSIGNIAVGSLVDFWCIQSKVWKSGAVRDVSREGIALISEQKGSMTFYVDILSRRLARYRYFTQEKVKNQAIERPPVSQRVNVNAPVEDKKPIQSIVRLQQPEPQMFFNIFESQDPFSLEGLQIGEYHNPRYSF